MTEIDIDGRRYELKSYVVVTDGVKVSTLRHVKILWQLGAILHIELLLKCVPSSLYYTFDEDLVSIFMDNFYLAIIPEGIATDERGTFFTGEIVDIVF